MRPSIGKCTVTLSWTEYLDYLVNGGAMLEQARTVALLMMSLHARIVSVQVLGPRGSDKREDDSRKRILVIGRPVQQKRGAA